MKCPNCQFDNVPEARFCGMCGTRLAQVCEVCGTANPLEYFFCNHCGASLTQLKPASPVFSEGESRTLPSQPEGEAVIFPIPLKTLSESPVSQRLEGQRRVATVILADVKNSTNLMEQIGTEAWVEMMNRVFQLLETEIYRFGGQVDQFRGDGLVAFFGTVSAHEDDPERAVLAGIAMQKAIKHYAGELVPEPGLSLELRVGINTGEVIVASVGDRDQHLEDTAMGEAVALAARLETAAEPGTVLVSENTYRLAEMKFTWDALGEINVKGISQPVRVFRPIEPRPETEWAHELSESDILTPVIGRIEEIQAIIQRVSELQEGRGGIILLTGEKGLGKSYVLTAVRQHFTRQEALLVEARGEEGAETEGKDYGQTGVTWLRGSCRSYEQNWPYSLWQDILQRWLGIHPGEPVGEAPERLQREALRLWGDEMDKYYPYLAAFLSFPLEKAIAERVRHLDAQSLQNQIFISIRSWLEALANLGPVVLVCSDLHWCDSASLELLKFCLSVCENESLLFLISFRTERASPVWEFRHFLETEFPHRLSQVELLPLSEQASRDLIAQLVGGAALSERTVALLVEKAEGNPYFVRELVKTLIDQGVLARDQKTESWKETRAISSLDMPDSLQSLLLARIDHLSPEERRTVEMASVVGQTFWRSVLETLIGDSNHLRQHLNVIMRAQLIQERGNTPVLGTEYNFSSTLLREIVYESLLSTQRCAYHLQIAEYLESLVGLDSRIRLDSLIAFHFRQAGFHDKELLYTHKAAEQALKVYANAEAFEHDTRALEILDAMETVNINEDQRYVIYTERFEVLNRRGSVNYSLGKIEAGDDDKRQLLPLARMIHDDPAWMVDALLNQPEINHPENQTELENGMRMAQQALELAQQTRDARREMYSLAAIGGLQVAMRDPAWHETGERLLSLARQLGDTEMEINALLRIGAIYGMDNIEKQKMYLETALSKVQSLDDPQVELNVLSTIGEQYERSGDYYRLLTEFQMKRLQISREIGNRLEEGYSLMMCGQIQSLYLGDYDSGLALEEEALQIWQATGQRLFAALRIAQIKTEQGKFDEALEILNNARPVSEENIYDLGRAGIDLVFAILHNAIGGESNYRLALNHITRVCALSSESRVSRQYEMAAKCESTAAHVGLARLLNEDEEKQFHLDQALESSKHALELYDDFGFVQIVECVSEGILYRRGLALDANGAEEAAREFYSKAFTEMMRKHALIPTDSLFSRTYLESIRLHRAIEQAYQKAFA